MEQLYTIYVQIDGSQDLGKLLTQMAEVNSDTVHFRGFDPKRFPDGRKLCGINVLSKIDINVIWSSLEDELGHGIEEIWSNLKGAYLEHPIRAAAE